jgi:hypothetical protein
VRFCGACGAPVHANASADAQADAAAGAAPARLSLSLDTETLRHFAVGVRCMLRLRLENGATQALASVAVHAEVARGGAAGEPLPPATTETLGPGESVVVPLWLTPAVAGFYELQGVVAAADRSGGRSYLRFTGVQFRVGAAGEAARVSVVHIDQSAARVVDNSRSQFAAPDEGRGGLVGEGVFRPLALRPLTAEQAAALCPALAATATAAGAPASPRGPQLQPGAAARFTIRTAQDQYEATAVLCQGDLATLYDARRISDGARVVVKIADDALDNDLIQAEVSALRLLRSEPSPQLKHLPVVLDQLHTRDGRLGTVLEYLDGLDLVQVRERLPRGLPVRHLIWLMRRSLSVLGWAHSRGVLHGNLDPAHILLRAQDHNVWLIDWCYAIVNPAQSGQGFRCLNEEYSPPEVAARKPPLPSSDMYSLGKCMYYVLGGDPRHKTLPAESDAYLAGDREAIDERIERFLQYCVLESPLSRAQDAWEAYRLLDKLRAEIWGPHQFYELTL